MLVNLPFVKGIHYLLRDDFTTAQAAPLSSPRTAEPGPGTLRVYGTDTAQNTSITADKRLRLVGDGSTWTRRAGYDDSLTRRAGLALMFDLTGNGTTNRFFGFNASVTPPAGGPNGTGAEHGVFVSGGSAGVRYSRVGVQLDLGYNLPTGSNPFLIVLRNAGSHVFHKIAGDWTTVWIDDAGILSTLFAGGGASFGTLELDNFRVLDLADLDSRFSDKSELATSAIDGTVAAGATFTHEADCQIEWTQSSLATSGATRILFRMQDSVNTWYAYVGTAGQFHLYEMASSVSTLRADAGTVVVAGHRIRIVAEGSTIRGYSNDVLRFTYNSSPTFQLATQGKRNDTFGTESGTISNLRAWTLAQDLTYTGDYGLATSRIAGSVSAGQTFTHEADFVMEWTQTTLPTTGPSQYVRFRQQDAENWFHNYISASGGFGLQIVKNGLLTNIYSNNGVVAAGHRCVIIAEGATIRGYSNNTLRWTYTSATDFQTETGGGFSQGGGGTVSNLVTYPRTVTLPEV